MDTRVTSMLLRMCAAVFSKDTNERAALLGDGIAARVWGWRSHILADKERFSWDSSELLSYLESTKYELLSYDFIAFCVEDDILAKFSVTDDIRITSSIHELKLNIDGSEISAFKLFNVVAVEYENAMLVHTYLAKYDSFFNYLPRNNAGRIMKAVDFRQSRYVKNHVPAPLDMDRNTFGRLFCQWSKMASKYKSRVVMHFVGKDLVATTEGVGFTVSDTSDVITPWETVHGSYEQFGAYADACQDVVTVEIPNDISVASFSFVGTPVSWLKKIRYAGATLGYHIQDDYAVIYKGQLSLLSSIMDAYNLKYMLFTKDSEGYCDALPGHEQYYFMHVPANRHCDENFANLQYAVSTCAYGKLFKALATIDEELPAKLDTILAQMED